MQIYVYVNIHKYIYIVVYKSIRSTAQTSRKKLKIEKSSFFSLSAGFLIPYLDTIRFSWKGTGGQTFLYTQIRQAFRPILQFVPMKELYDKERVGN